MKNRITELFNIKCPIVLGGMAGVTDAKLAAAVSEAGGLGTIAGATESAESLAAEISHLRAITKLPFAVNIPLMASQAKDLIQVVMESKVPVVITAAGSPAIYTASLKQAGSRVVHVIPCVDAAKKAESAGVNAVIAEGFESGGFASPFEVGTLALIPQVVDAVRIPVLAAGGVVDARGYAACRILGAEGASVGTAFLATVECTKIGSAWREQILSGRDVSTKIFARGIAPLRMLANRWTEELEKLISAGVTKKDIMRFIFSGDPMSFEDGPFACGQAVGLVRRIRTVKEVMDDFVIGSEELLKRMAARD
ncbi:MAG: NAD(P)H-dependent flavin oxidoreductase [Syntrophales bacterium]|jgi:enoyl-[acyl-carrier protein] reductase II